jgi:hypothetical protein
MTVNVSKETILVADFFAPWHLIILLTMFAIFTVPFWQILKRMGFPPALSLLVWIPLIGLVVLYYVAFAEWKAVGNRNTNIP